jgi:hypothetical protein
MPDISKARSTEPYRNGTVAVVLSHGPAIQSRVIGKLEEVDENLGERVGPDTGGISNGEG